MQIQKTIFLFVFNICEIQYMDTQKKKDGRAGNGGFRHGAGRKKGTGVESANKVVRIPNAVLDEADKQGVTNLTALLVKGAKKELKMPPFDEVFEPEIKPKKSRAKKK